MSEPAEQSIDDYTIICVIGKGLFGQVYLVKENKSDRVYAMKVVKKRLIEKQNKLQRIFTERNLLIQFEHPFIIKIVSSFQNEHKFYFILEYCPGGQLYNLLSIKEKFSEEQYSFFNAGQSFTHHRDLKPENIFIDKSGYIKLTDFGLSKKLKKNQQSTFSMSGMPEYMAPQILFQKQCNKAVDFWCLGSLLHQMLTGFAPFFSQNLNELYEAIKYQEFTVDEEFQLSKECISLLEGLFTKQPSKRLGMKGLQQFQEHPWFKGIDWKAVINKKYSAPFIPILKNQQDTTYFSAALTSSNVDSVSSYASSPSRQKEHSQIDDKYFSGFDFNGDEAESVGQK